MESQFFVSLLQIIWIDLLLSGDNAVVIALACRGLPEKQRKIGILLGAGAAVLLRILFALIITYLLSIPFLKLVGGLLLFWIAIKLAVGEEEDGEHGGIEETGSLWKAVRTVAIADAVMSLDNVLAIAAASHGNVWLFVFGLALTVPLIVFGSSLVLGIIERFPIFVWAGRGVLGWIAGGDADDRSGDRGPARRREPGLGEAGRARAGHHGGRRPAPLHGGGDRGGDRAGDRLDVEEARRGQARLSAIPRRPSRPPPARGLG